MTLPRALSELICRVLIGVFLTAQLAISAYACPTGSPAPEQSAMAQESQAMPADCDQMDRGVANLCLEHCRFGQQASDPAPAPIVLAPVPALLYTLPMDSGPGDVAGVPLPSSAPLLAGAPPPPHAILHCVL